MLMYEKLIIINKIIFFFNINVLAEQNCMRSFDKTRGLN